MFKLITSEEHLKHHLRSTIMSIERRNSLFRLESFDNRYIDDHIEHCRRRRISPPILVSTYTVWDNNNIPMLTYVPCSRSIAKTLVYKKTNKLNSLLWKLCNNPGEYYTYERMTAMNKNINNDSIVSAEDSFYGDDSPTRAMLVTYTIYPGVRDHPTLRFFIVTLKEAKSLVYFEKDKLVSKKVNDIGKKVYGLIDQFSVEQKMDIIVDLLKETE